MEATAHDRTLSQRITEAAMGGVLGYYGIRRGGLGGYALAALGGVLIYRGLRSRTTILRVRDTGAAGEPVLELAAREGRRPAEAEGAVHVESTLQVNKPAEELYRFWRDFRNLPHVIDFVASVQPLEGGRSHWKARMPGGIGAGWDSVIENDEPGRRIGWRSVDPAPVPNRGSVAFRPLSDSSTEVTLVLDYRPPAGPLGALVMNLLGGDPQQRAADTLARFKRLMETGEVANLQPLTE